MKKLKKMEALLSKKFEASSERIMGGTGPVETTYGPNRQTSNQHEGTPDCQRVTYNPQGYPQGTQGYDKCGIAPII